MDPARGRAFQRAHHRGSDPLRRTALRASLDFGRLFRIGARVSVLHISRQRLGLPERRDGRADLENLHDRGGPKPTKKNSIGTQLWAPSGVAVWNSPTVDAKRRAIYFGTGDSATEPAPDSSDSIMALRTWIVVKCAGCFKRNRTMRPSADAGAGAEKRVKRARSTRARTGTSVRRPFLRRSPTAAIFFARSQ